MSEAVAAPFRGVDLGLPIKPITLADAPAAMGTGATRTPGGILVDIPAALSRQSIVVSQWAISANLVLSRILGALPAPVNLAVAQSASAWTLPPGTYYWQVTALDAGGETTGSAEVSSSPTNFARNLTWVTVPAATGYKIYRSTVSGGEVNSPALIGTVGSSVSQFLDTGIVATAGAVPVTNTTSTPSALPQFGRLGRLLGGPLRHSAVQTTGTGISAAAVAPWTTPFVFPDDISNLATLWDGENDASPPMEAWTNPMPVNIATTLNSPITLAASEQLGICLALTPTIGQNVALYVVNARWSLTYELA